MLLFWIPALLIALSVHEYAHAKMADYLGDPTPRLKGRLTLNPLVHLDPLGTFALFFFRFGWGKPVPIDPFNLQNPRKDQALIALAGPASNLALFLLLALFSWVFGLSSYPLVYAFIINLAILNLGLGFFNLLPFGPLDGAKIFLGLMPSSSVSEWEEVINRYGLIFLLFIFFPVLNGNSLLGLTLGKIISFLIDLFFPLNYI